MADIEVELSRIIIDEASDQQVIVLKEKKGERSLPIVIGIVEIMAIDRRLKGRTTIRPLTHELLSNTSKKVEVDSRPSDAIAIAVASDVPLYAAEHIFGKE
jgi:bifunctional DNase/RNase